MEEIRITIEGTDKATGCPNPATEDWVTGYPKLAAAMGVIPETAIFRRFAALNAQNLLYFQAELVELEQKLKETQLADSQNPHGMKSKYALDWFWLSNSAEYGDETQLRILKEIRAKLKEYSRWHSLGFEVGLVQLTQNR
jgi:hypothetical protein